MNRPDALNLDPLTRHLLDQAAPSLPSQPGQSDPTQDAYIAALIADRHRGVRHAAATLRRAGWSPRLILAAHEALAPLEGALEREPRHLMQALLNAEALRGVAGSWGISPAVWGLQCRRLDQGGASALRLVIRELRIQPRAGWLWTDLMKGAARSLPAVGLEERTLS